MARKQLTIASGRDQFALKGEKTRNQGDFLSEKSLNEPFGENRTTLTAAEWRLKVARYSTLGGRGALALEESASATIFGGRM